MALSFVYDIALINWFYCFISHLQLLVILC